MSDSEAAEGGSKLCDLWEIAELAKKCIFIKDQQEKHDIEAVDSVQGNDLNAVHAVDADLDSEDAKHHNMKQHNLMILFQVSKILGS